MTKVHHDAQAAEQRRAHPHSIYFLTALDALAQWKVGPHTRILDVGSGNAEFAAMVRERFGARVTCLDYAPAHIEHARKLGFDTLSANLESDEGLRSLVADHLGEFDIITAFEVIEHIFSTDNLLAAFHRLLKPRGRLLISTPNMSYFLLRLYSLLRGNIPYGEGHHIRFFYRRKLFQTFLMNGFDQVRDLSAGYGAKALDYLIGENQPIRKSFFRLLYYGLRLIIPRSSSWAHAKLIATAERAEVDPLGLNETSRDVLYREIPESRQRKAIERLMPLRTAGWFTEHPRLRAFLDAEAARFHIPA